MDEEACNQHLEQHFVVWICLLLLTSSSMYSEQGWVELLGSRSLSATSFYKTRYIVFLQLPLHERIIPNLVKSIEVVAFSSSTQETVKLRSACFYYKVIWPQIKTFSR
ncbi:hypothetical protein OS493_032075 [Desmophyllum pertusum]|uniref:Uncharacterized protein n=1 Tax=Desmophyllum pertusum TaxID=174260 RepID=A0A9W9YZM1_9CNID|nr:hypothetical protein OS493_032075 [Desmophyllum pertusum]